MRLRHGRHSYGNVWVPFCSLKLIGHERRYLRILSGQVGMESDRSYASDSLYSIEIGAGSVDGMFSRTLYEKSSEEGEQIEGTIGVSYLQAGVSTISQASSRHLRTRQRSHQQTMKM